MKLFKSFTPESILVGLGITAVMYLVTPIIKDFADDVKSNKKVFTYSNGNQNKVVFDKYTMK
ncbi:MAG: hypothetical protein SA378_03345 [Sedimentibacter sp.]|uniref:hypothetical protein n=1 Tax=Sedimentibacter sp. TaxID=1960295 RepID=UPI002981BD2D|nr:hypothetical protein [Sedimentibacter sp.]MDW5299161.1 hypothetical protein [Sedimentibacter sp.]